MHPHTVASATCRKTPNSVTSFPDAKRTRTGADDVVVVEKVLSASSAVPSSVVLPSSLPNDLYNVKREHDKVVERFGGHVDFFLRRREPDARTALQEIQWKARESAYYYDGDEELYALVLEIYNQDQAKQPFHPAQVVPLPLPSDTPSCYHTCQDCSRSLVGKESSHATHCMKIMRFTGERYCYRCLGCFGCSLAITYGKDRSAMKARWNKDTGHAKTPIEETTETLEPGWLTGWSKHPHWREDCPLKTFTPSCAHSACANCRCYVCNRPASECPQWKELHCRAIRGKHEWDLLHQQNSPEEINPNFFDFHDLPRICTAKEKKQQEDRARNAQFEYDDFDTMMYALELYNRQWCKPHPENNPIFLRYVKDHQNVPKEKVFGWRPSFEPYSYAKILGHHKNPCSQCGRSFNDPGQKIYFHQQFNWGKVCSGCMGRNCCSRFGSKKATILKLLEEWRAKQVYRIVGDMYYMPNTHVTNYVPPLFHP